ncbi:AAA family ATPase [Candidatus Phytoplasma australiense]|uniref:VCP-like ATPase n=1 Tax=Strawberry lethal yellows phytoplasma (CPA) str. NZSb11 TaxID=980422 RepID=R4S278_PHYAS|nr:AAA family ATPase [Candidatus Phytoplasma australiense]AGL90913.1 VCP-like ATPase [Strawberry lethal yellows phytoplasma (CPA) str. NZSb11]
MKLKNKIYLSFLALFGFILLILFIVGITKKENNIKPLINPTITQPPNNQLDSEAKEELNKLQKCLKDLEIINQQNINNNKKLIEEDNQLSQQINSNLETIKTLNLQINNLNQELDQKSKELNNKETNLTDETKSQLETEIKNLNQQIADLSKQRNQINEATQPLTKKRVENTKSQVSNKKIIENVQSETNKTTQFKDIYQKISDLQQAINYNNASKENIKELIIKHQDNLREVQNLKSYDLFLDGQLIQFDKQIKTLQAKLQAIQNNQPWTTQKKKITFNDVYGMEEEKEQFRFLIHYFNATKHALGYENVKPTGYLLYGPPGTGKSHLIEGLCGESGVHYIELEPSKFDKTYVGEGNEELEKIWAEAESHDKTIIFIDEISGLANREDKNSNKTSINIVNNLLTKLDGFKRSEKQIVLMGATNHLDQIDSALRSRFQQEIKIDSFKKEEIPGFLEFLILKNDWRISFHTFNYLKTLVKKIPAEKQLTNRDLVKLLRTAFQIYDLLAVENENHEVMLPSDLDEALDQILEIKNPHNDIMKRRKECEEQYESWKQGFLKYRKPPKDTTMIKEKYRFNGLNGFGRGHHCEYEPTDIMQFMKNPFDKWETKLSSIDFFDTFHTKHKNDDSQFNNMFINNYVDHYTELNYKGPKWLIEEDKDFFMDEVTCHIIDPKDSSFPKREMKNYYLHFNPKQRYITLYTKKFNTKNN